MSERPKNVGRVSTRQTTSAHGDVGLRPSVVSLSNHEAANPTYGGLGLAGEWRESTWGEEISLEYGKALRGYDGANGKFRVFGSNGPIGWTSQPLVQGPGVILGRKGAYRGVQYSREPFFVIDTAYYVVPKSDLDMRWLYYAIQHHKLGEIDDGSPIPSTTRSAVYVRDFLVPPLPEQKSIAHILGSLDDKIELNRRMNATLEAMARALFQSWFVDFDPVRAKLDGRKPAGLDAATAALFPAHFQDSTLGHIPQGWEVVRLDDIAHVMMGLSPDGESYNSEGVGMPLINGPVEFGDYFPVKTKWTEAATRFAAENDLIFCVRGSTTGRRVVSDGKYCIGRGVCSIRAKGGFYNFLYQTINIGLDRLLEKTTGSVFPSLSAPDIKGFTVIRPNEDVLEAYERITKPLILRIHENHHQSRTLATLRDTLLPKLLSGEIARAR
ncbi:MAG: restriction endonuclease subunit S [Acidithiobacillus sp.]